MGGDGAARSQAGHFRRCWELLAPIAGIGHALGTAAVRGVIGRHVGEGRQRLALGGAGCARGIQLGHALAPQRHGVAVGRKVVRALVPAVGTGAQLEKDLPGQRALQRVDGGLHVLLHRGPGALGGVWRTTQINDFEGGASGWVQPLLDALRRFPHE